MWRLTALLGLALAEEFREVQEEGLPYRSHTYDLWHLIMTSYYDSSNDSYDLFLRSALRSARTPCPRSAWRSSWRAATTATAS